MAANGLGPLLSGQQQQQPTPQQQRRRRRPGPVAVAPVRLASLSGEHDVLGGGSDGGSASDGGSPRQRDWRRERRQRAEELFTHYEGKA